MLIDIDEDKVDMRNVGDVDRDLSRDRYKRNVMRDKQALWSNREVPYEFHSSIPGEEIKPLEPFTFIAPCTTTTRIPCALKSLLLTILACLRGP